VLVGWISDVTGSLEIAFYIVFPPVIGGLLLLLRARHTLDADAQAIITAIIEETQMLEAERERLAAEEVAAAAEGAGRGADAGVDLDGVHDPDHEPELENPRT
jgi:hypothetical protein